MREMAVAATNDGREDVQPGGGTSAISDHSRDYKTRAGIHTAWRKREGILSDLCCNCKIRTGTTYSLEVERATCPIAD